MDELSQIKKEARKNLKGNLKPAIITSIIFVFIITVLSFIQTYSQINDILYILLSIVVFALIIPINYAFLASLYKIKQKEKITLKSCFKYTFKNFKKSWSIFGNMLSKMILLLIIFLIFTIILSIGATMLANSNIDLTSINNTSNIDENIKNGLILSLTGTIGYTVCFILFIPQFFKYCFANLISIKNESESPKESVKKSAIFMKGRKWSLFKLFISFIFLFIVSLIPFALCMDILEQPILALIAYILCFSCILPYVIFSYFEFYEKQSDK